MSGPLKRKLSKKLTNPEKLAKMPKNDLDLDSASNAMRTEQKAPTDTKKLKIEKDESSSTENITDRLSRSFYDKPCIDLAKDLLGKKLYCLTESGEKLCGKIVETEAYLGGEDKGAHSYQGKKTEKNEAMFMQHGTAYVYNIYGMYCCVNISSRGDGAAVLIRALEPLLGQETMKKLRSGKKEKTKAFKNKELCSGPSKLCQALNIDKKMLNKQDLTTFKRAWLEDGDTISNDEIVKCKRIGIDYAGEWAAKPLRYYILGNECVSKKDKDVEKSMQKG